MVENKTPKSLADLMPSAPKIEITPLAEEKTKKKPPSSPLPTPKAEKKIPYIDSLYLFNSENDLDRDEREFYLKRRRKYLEEYSLNDSADMGIIHRIIMEEIIGERIYKQVLENPDNPVLGDRLTESNKRYQAALETLGASRDKRMRNRESGGVSVADLAKTYFDERKTVFESEKAKRDLEDLAVEEQQKQFFELQFGAIEQAGIWQESDGFEDEE